MTLLFWTLLACVPKTVEAPPAAEEDVAVIAASPLHGGLLGSKRDQWVDRGRFQDLYPRLETIEALLKNEPEGIVRTGLRYLLSDSRVSLLLCGVSTIEELDVCVSVSDGVYLSEDRIAEIEGIDA